MHINNISEKALSFILHKRFHPGNYKNLEKVWLAEQDAAARAARQEELANKRLQEHRLEELKREHSAGTRQALQWVTANDEFGKVFARNDDPAKPTPPPTNDKQRKKPYILAEVNRYGTVDDADLQRKLKEDPYMLIKKAEVLKVRREERKRTRGAAPYPPVDARPSGEHDSPARSMRDESPPRRVRNESPPQRVDSPPPRRYRDHSPPRHHVDDSPPRRYPDRSLSPPPRGDGRPRLGRNGTPPRRNQQQSPPRRDDLPPRRYRDDSPPRRYRDVSPPRRYRDDSPPRRYRDVSPPRRYRDDLPPRRYRDDSPPRRYRDDLPPRRYRDDSPPRRYRDDSSPSGRQVRESPSRRVRGNSPLRQPYNDRSLPVQNRNQSPPQRHRDESLPGGVRRGPAADVAVESAEHKLLAASPDNEPTLDRKDSDGELGPPASMAVSIRERQVNRARMLGRELPEERAAHTRVRDPGEPMTLEEMADAGSRLQDQRSKRARKHDLEVLMSERVRNLVPDFL